MLFMNAVKEYTTPADRQRAAQAETLKVARSQPRIFVTCKPYEAQTYANIW